MNLEVVFLLVSFTALTVFLIYVSRVLGFLLRLGIAAVIAFVILSQVDFRSWKMCQGKRSQRNAIQQFLCK